MRAEFPEAVPDAGAVTAHTLLNCLVREISTPERQARVEGGYLVVRLPRRDLLLRVRVRRESPTGAHRLTGPVEACRNGAWTPLGWQRLARAVEQELELRTGEVNPEFCSQVAASHTTVAAALARPGVPPPEDAYLASEQALRFGHRYHPAPKARSGPAETALRYAPELHRRFRLHHLAAPADLVEEHCDDPALSGLLDRLTTGGDGDGNGDGGAGPRPDDEHRLLPLHPWQYRLLRDGGVLDAALRSGRLVDLGPAGPPVTPTASVRTVHHPGLASFLKLSLSVRITNCVRKNARYELAGAVALTRALRPVAADLAAAFPGTVVMAEPVSRTLRTGDDRLAEGLGVIVREGLAGHLAEGVTPLLAAAIADEHSRGPASAAALLDRGPGTPEALLVWWDAYLRVLVPPVLWAYLHHGVVFEPHLQNVVVGVGTDGVPVQVLLRDMEGTKLLPAHHGAALADLPAQVRDQVAYEPGRGWDRVVYCLVVNHLAEVLAVLADRHPSLERDLWLRVRDCLQRYRRDHGDAPELRALLAGVPLPAKANLLTRWQRQADRFAGYVPVPNPLSPQPPGPAPTPTARLAALTAS